MVSSKVRGPHASRQPAVLPFLVYLHQPFPKNPTQWVSDGVVWKRSNLNGLPHRRYSCLATGVSQGHGLRRQNVPIRQPGRPRCICAHARCRRCIRMPATSRAPVSCWMSYRRVGCRWVSSEGNARSPAASPEVKWGFRDGVFGHLGVGLAAANHVTPNRAFRSLPLTTEKGGL